jgi:hypothetical protein
MKNFIDIIVCSRRLSREISQHLQKKAIFKGIPFDIVHSIGGHNFVIKNCVLSRTCELFDKSPCRIHCVRSQVAVAITCSLVESRCLCVERYPITRREIEQLQETKSVYAHSGRYVFNVHLTRNCFEPVSTTGLLNINRHWWVE